MVRNRQTNVRIDGYVGSLAFSHHFSAMYQDRHARSRSRTRVCQRLASTKEPPGCTASPIRSPKFRVGILHAILLEPGDSGRQLELSPSCWLDGGERCSAASASLRLSLSHYARFFRYFAVKLLVVRRATLPFLGVDGCHAT